MADRPRCMNCGVETPRQEDWDGTEGSHPEWCWGDPIVCEQFRNETLARLRAVAIGWLRPDQP